MTWFKVDDSLGFHAKTIAAGNAAMGLWVRAGSWCSQQLTDGVIPRQVAATLGTAAQAKALVHAGLWLIHEDGYCFHEWDRYQPSAAEARAEQAKKHEKKAEAGRLGGIASGIARRKHEGSNLEANGEANGKQNEAPTRPDPTRSASETSSPQKAPAKHTIPEDWQPTPEDLAWATEKAPLVDVPITTEHFVGYWLERGDKRPGWSRSWRAWLSKEQERQAARPQLRAVGTNWRPGQRGSWDV